MWQAIVTPHHKCFASSLTASIFQSKRACPQLTTLKEFARGANRRTLDISTRRNTSQAFTPSHSNRCGCQHFRATARVGPARALTVATRATAHKHSEQEEIMFDR